ncbi:hypothetical protein QTN47_17040 [Danxiaibacter flavus]|uniref:Uncharacterized protein n=1 Tax=Danxiaibacter flavus TaxID=3049108 RepID=A0ABV3ZHC9_9BACT|nr:hypothetical protein QNM32_17050 [Chitinophagaceae bacterium DXS]
MEKQIDNIITAIEVAIDDFQKQIPGIQEKMFNELQTLVKDLGVQNGKILANLDNLKLIGNIKNKIERIIISNSYKAKVQQFVKSYQAVRNLHDDYFAQFNVTFPKKETYDVIKQLAVDSTLNSLLGAGISANVIDKVGEILKTNTTSAASYSDMINQLRSYVLTGNETEGVLERYTKQITTDAINQYSAQYHQAVSSDLNFSWGRYVGSNITTSREFCLKLTKKDYIHKSELPEIIKGDIDGHQCKLSKSTGLPLGMVSGTTPGNFQIYRGGYNCGHQFLMVPDSSVPEATKNRILIVPVEKLKKDGYETIAHDDKKGNYIMAHPDHVANKNKKDGAKEMANNVAMAKLFFGRGSSIELMPSDIEKPSLDAKIDGKLWEFETVHKDKFSSIQNRIHEASKQILNYNRAFRERNPVNLAIALPDNVSKENIYSALRLAVKHNYRIDRLSLKVGDALIELTKEDIHQGKFYGIVADMLKR